MQQRNHNVERTPFVSAADQGMPCLMSAAAVIAGSVVALALLPMEPLTQHMLHHIVLMNALAPLCAVALVNDRPSQRLPWAPLLWLATVVQMLLLWAWHAPSVHAVASEPAVHVAVLAGLFLAALVFWTAVVIISARSAWQTMLALLVTGKFACLLGALLVFAPRVLYPAQFGACPIEGISLQDQQLAGLLMVSACLLSYVLAGVVVAAQMLRGIMRNSIPQNSPMAADR